MSPKIAAYRANPHKSSLFCCWKPSHSQELAKEQQTQNDAMVKGLQQNIQKPAYRKAFLQCIHTLQTYKNAIVAPLQEARLGMIVDLLGLPQETFQTLQAWACHTNENWLFRPFYTQSITDLLDTLGYRLGERRPKDVTDDDLENLLTELYQEAVETKDAPTLQKFWSTPAYLYPLLQPSPHPKTGVPQALWQAPFYFSAEIAAQCVTLFTPEALQNTFQQPPPPNIPLGLSPLTPRCYEDFTRFKGKLERYFYVTIPELVGMLYGRDFLQNNIKTPSEVLKAALKLGYLDDSLLNSLLQQPGHSETRDTLLAQIQTLVQGPETLFNPLNYERFQHTPWPIHRTDNVDRLFAKALKKALHFHALDPRTITLTYYTPSRTVLELFRRLFHSPGALPNLLNNFSQVFNRTIDSPPGSIPLDFMLTVLEKVQSLGGARGVRSLITMPLSKTEISVNIEAMLLLNTRLLLWGYEPQLDAHLGDYLTPQQIAQITAFIGAAAGDRTAFLQHGLALAVQYNCPIAAEYFLELGALPDITTPTGQNLLVCAIESEDYEVAATLYEPRSLPPKLTQELNARCSVDSLFQKKRESLGRFIQERRTRIASADKEGLTAFALGLRKNPSDDDAPSRPKALEAAFTNTVFDPQTLGLIANFVTGLQPPRKLLP